jgi:K+-transporting ATPase ATPase B chain
MSRKQLALFEPTLVLQALKEAVKKLNPQAQWRNPVMFIVWIGSLLTTCICIAMASGAMPGNALFSAAISGWSPYCSLISPRRWQKAAVKRRPTV